MCPPTSGVMNTALSICLTYAKVLGRSLLKLEIQLSSRDRKYTQDETLRAGDTAFLACTKPWVQSPAINWV